MNKIAVKQTSAVLYATGILFILAGAFQLMEMNHGIALGIASFYFTWVIGNHHKKATHQHVMHR